MTRSSRFQGHADIPGKGRGLSSKGTDSWDKNVYEKLGYKAFMNDTARVISMQYMSEQALLSDFFFREKSFILPKAYINYLCLFHTVHEKFTSFSYLSETITGATVRV